jgi:hypothetical protein
MSSSFDVISESAFEGSVASHASIGLLGWFLFLSLVSGVSSALVYSIIVGDVFYLLISAALWMLAWRIDETRQPSIVWLTSDLRGQSSWSLFTLDTEEMVVLRKITLILIALVVIGSAVHFLE